MHNLRRIIWLAMLLIGVTATPVFAGHIPVALDVPWLRPDVGRYLEFINHTEHPGLIGIPVPASPPGVIVTEEHTGYTRADGVDVVEVGDGDVTHGDRADFDWVQEHRSDEFAGTSNHPGLIGAMGWTIGVTEPSPHVDPGTGTSHGHSVAEVPPGPLPELFNPDETSFFDAVDVFSIISIGEDSDATVRDMALDYEVAFGNSVTGASSPGVPVVVWVPGWTAATGIDDYVARWHAAIPGAYDLVAIEPAAGFGHDEVTEIDAVKAVERGGEGRIPEPTSLLIWSLLGALGIAVGWRRKRRV